MSAFDQQRADDPEWRKAALRLFLAFNTRQDFFTAQLYHLIHKADYGHKRKLAAGFPIEVMIHEEWEVTPNETDFFQRYRVGELIHDPDKKVYDRLHGPKDEESG